MYPDDNLKDDAIVTTALCLLISAIIYLSIAKGGYAPADECANRIIETLSPVNVNKLTEGRAGLPTRYIDVRLWCEENLDTWQDKLLLQYRK